MVRVESVRPSEESTGASGLGAAAGTPHRILLVEDHADTREVLTRLLKGLGFVVTAVGTVKESVAAAERYAFDLLLSDIGLPDGSGST